MLSSPAYSQIPTSVAVPTGPGQDDSAELKDILSRDIPWESYLAARLVTEKDVQLIRRYDKRSEELQASLLDESGSAYVEAFVSVLRNVTKEETVQYVLALLLQTLQSNPARAKLFYPTADGRGPPDSAAVLLRLLQRPDWFTQEKAAKVLAAVIAARPDKGSVGYANGVGPAHPSSSQAPGGEAVDTVVSTFLDWLLGQLRRPTNLARSVPTTVAALAVLLRDKGARAQLTRAGGVPLLVPLLRSCNSPTNSQLLYEICLCFWQLSYYAPAAEAITTSGAVKPLVEVLRAAQKEKVVRVCLLVMRNLLEAAAVAKTDGPAADMVEAGMQKVVAVRAMQSWGDEDVPELLVSIGDKLKEGVQVLSSWDKYKKEVLSGTLDWSPMHTSEQFWRSNIDKFDEKDFQVLRVLLKLLESSRDTRTLAVGCSDLGKFIEVHPQGRFIVSDLRGKELVMRLMLHPDPDVQKRALLAMQRIMLPRDKLDFLQPGSAAAS